MHRFLGIQAVTFDVGGTLLSPSPSVGAIYARIAREAVGISLDPQLLDHRFAQAWAQAQPFHFSRSDWAAVVDATFADLLSPPPSQSFFPLLYEAFAQPTAWRLHEDVLPTLEALAAQGLDLGIISNWDERLRPLLHALRLDRYLSCIVISSEIGFTKPSRVAFEEALRQLGRPASAVLHVGDSLRLDFAAASAAGLAALHLRRDAPAHDFQIASLRDILPWIDPHESSPRFSPKILQRED